MSRRALERILALRTLEEERAEAEMSRKRRLQQLRLNELRASKERSAAALRMLHAALSSSDRPSAIAAEMAMAFGPLERNVLQRQITQLNPIVEAAAIAWRSARMCRLQIQTLADSAEVRLQQEREVEERKALDAWFLSDKVRRDANENLQRKLPVTTETAGTARAGDFGE